MSLNSTPFKVFVTGMDEQMNLNVFKVICKGSIPGSFWRTGLRGTEQGNHDD